MSTPAPAKSQDTVSLKYNIKYEVVVEGKSYQLELAQHEGRWHCRVNGKEVPIDPVLTRSNVLSILIEGKQYEVKREHTATDLHFWVQSARYGAEVRDPRSLRSRKSATGGAAGPQKIKAPMPGKVVRVLAKAGDEVEAGQGVVVVEAMKMQNELKSIKKGVVKQVLVAEGASVTAGEVLAIVE